MPLFRRRQAAASDVLTFSVGVDGHVVVVGGKDGGCVMLHELEQYLGAVGRYGHKLADGRDSIAMQNAKMDYVEMAEAAVTVVSLAVEELCAQEIIAESDVPARPRFAAVDPNLATYDYIQTTYARAQRRVEWMRAVDATLRERGIAIEKPPPN